MAPTPQNDSASAPTPTTVPAGPTPLSASTIAILKATAPVVKQHGTAITSAMYGALFREHPEVQSLFNMSHHRVSGSTSGGAPAGVSRQASALANAVIAFAANCDRLSALGDAVPRMVHKHVSLNVRAEHYPLVGGCLLGAIKTVLKDAATPEIMAAWKEGYFFLADLLIGAEDAARAEMERQQGGWSGFRELRVARKQQESTEVTSFYLESMEQSQPLMSFKPGQYLSLKFDKLEEGRAVVRNYSLSCAPGLEYYRISVKKEAGNAEANIPAGVVSSHLHENVEVGSALLVGPPCGHFFLQKSQKPIVFLSGGVGVTPLLSMLEHLVTSSATLKDQQPVVFVQYVRNPEVHAFGPRLEELANKHAFVSSHVVCGPGQSFNLAQLEKWLPSHDCEFYFCGPAGFMTTVNHALTKQWELPAAQLHYEFFGPTQNVDV